MKYYLKMFLIFSVLMLAIPSIVMIKPKNSKVPTDQSQTPTFDKITTVQISDSTTAEVTEIGFNDYLTGCVLAQISCDFELETIKTQATICRTCVYNKLCEEEKTTDFSSFQDYFSIEKAKEYYGENFDTAYALATQAVKDTDGIIITYQGLPIVTAFHPISCGFTESAEDIFSEKIPYLLSVKSPQDTEIKGFEQVVEVSHEEVFSRLCAYFEIEKGKNFTLDIKKQTSHQTVLVLEFSCDDTKKEITGVEFAQIFGLNSCNLDINISEDLYTITCRGAGHLVGLSQYGANVLAQQGKTFEEIIKYYFSDVSLTILQ